MSALHHALRGAVATGLGALGMLLIHQDRGYWIMLTAMVVLQSNLGATLKKSRARVAGTLMGVFIGAIVTIYVLPYHALAMSIVLLLIFYAIYLVPFSYALSVFFITVLLIILLTGQASPWHFALERAIDTLLGTLIGMLCAFLLWPSWAKHDFNDSLAENLKQDAHLLTLFRDEIMGAKSPTLESDLLKPQNILNKNRMRFDESSYEPGARSKFRGVAYAIILAEERIYHVLLGLHVLLRDLLPSFGKYPDLKDVAGHGIDVIVAMIENLIEAIHLKAYFPIFPELDRLLNEAQQKLKENPFLQKDSSLALNSRFLIYNFKGIVLELKHISEALKLQV